MKSNSGATSRSMTNQSYCHIIFLSREGVMQSRIVICLVPDISEMSDVSQEVRVEEVGL